MISSNTLQNNWISEGQPRSNIDTMCPMLRVLENYKRSINYFNTVSTRSSISKKTSELKRAELQKTTIFPEIKKSIILPSCLEQAVNNEARSNKVYKTMRVKETELTREAESSREMVLKDSTTRQEPEIAYFLPKKQSIDSEEGEGKATSQGESTLLQRKLVSRRTHQKSNKQFEWRNIKGVVFRKKSGISETASSKNCGDAL